MKLFNCELLVVFASIGSIIIAFKIDCLRVAVLLYRGDADRVFLQFLGLDFVKVVCCSWGIRVIYLIASVGVEIPKDILWTSKFGCSVMASAKSDSEAVFKGRCIVSFPLVRSLSSPLV
ncbi:hypothetical protein NC651_034824 [Populus alba x Populus x berolinensis]|nr:hypothetical protein NC651_034824 [Populus alba x Populus x berolinensis]